MHVQCAKIVVQSTKIAWQHVGLHGQHQAALRRRDALRVQATHVAHRRQAVQQRDHLQHGEGNRGVKLGENT